MNKEILKLRGTLQQDHQLAEYTSWKIGGPAEYFYRPVDLEDLMQLLRSWEDNPITILGAATNVLIRDKGIKGLVVYLRNTLNNLQIIDDFNLRTESGVSLAHLIKKCIDAGMTDMTFMAGIPGTIGGALKMNAGANGDCIWNHVQSVETINRRGEIRTRQANEFKAAYREIDGLDPDEWFVAANLVFARGKKSEAQEKIQTYLKKRANSQPLNKPNCGSVFRNPTGDYAARLIESCGLKGKTIGGAQVSEKHANFIINHDNAKAIDIEALIQEIMDTVEKSTGIKLIPEVHILGQK
ncbi:MAG: UDP-N-acetylmuramate dehydrogenase [Gammaproteobacteria bacterium]|nr:UDP-N-acetylmuramate dehydrogenase [Gammaproteobacteria bacterium]